jgi:hypothetical protein
MPQPNSHEVHIDGPLTTLSVSYLQDPGMFIADAMFPRIPVNHQSDKYYVYDIGDMYRNNMAPRGEATESAGATYSFTTANYNTELFALHKMVSKRSQANSDAALNPMQTAVKWLTQQERIKRDVEFAAKFLTTGIWDTDVTVADPVDSASSDPVGMINDYQLTVLGATGFEPRTLAVTAKGWKELKNHPDILGRLAGGATPGAPAVANRANVAAILDVDEIVVTSAVVNSAAEGVTDSVGFITTGDALLCYVEPNPGLDSVTAGATFVYSGDLGLEGRTIGTIEEPLKKATRVEIEAEWDMKVVASALGVFFNGFVSS